jgi:hypothetical protein
MQQVARVEVQVLRDRSLMLRWQLQLKVVAQQQEQQEIRAQTDQTEAQTRMDLARVQVAAVEQQRDSTTHLAAMAETVCAAQAQVVAVVAEALQWEVRQVERVETGSQSLLRSATHEIRNASIKHGR